jgi:hypothetical protein
MSGSKRNGAAILFFGLGIVLFGGSFVLDLAGLRGAGIAFLALGLILWLRTRKQSKGPGA